MNIPHELSLIIQRSHSLKEILDSAVEIIAQELGTDVCSVYLLDPDSHELKLMATHGLDKAAVGKVSLKLGQGLTGRVVAEMRSLSVEDASSHPGYLYFPETREERFRSFLGVPMAIRNRPVGAIVVQTREVRSHSRQEVQTLYTIAAQLVGVVENARLIEALDRGDEGGGYLEEVLSWHLPGRPPRRAPVDLEFRGSASSPGIAMAEAVVRGTYELDPKVAQEPFRGAEEEKARVKDALEKTRSDLLRIQKAAEKEADEEHALIFSSHILLLNDPVLRERIDRSIDDGTTAPLAVQHALNEFAERLHKVADPYIRDRIEDIFDLRGRVLGHILYGEAYTPNVSERIVVSGGTPPSLVVELKAKGARALVTETGGVTSHGALLARSMGIPAVTGVADACTLVKSGDRLIVDGSTGKVILNPSPKTVERYEAQARTFEDEHAGAEKYCHVPARTADGRRIPVLANIGVAADLAVAVRNGAEGVGLYRTEFPFIIREHFPTREEQIRIYRKAYETFPEGPIHFRLLDLGADKFLPRGALVSDRNPFRGYRSIRLLLDNIAVLRDQVQAFALAAGTRPLSILVPMVSALREVLEVKKHIQDALEELDDESAQKKPAIGVMIELPAAVEITDRLAREVDYFSIGTNDLLQYALGVDRENARLAAAASPYHPAILGMIRRTVAAARAASRPVSVCGEMASDWRLALLLVAMGVDSLSVTPSAILELKEALATHSVSGLENHLDEVVNLSEPTEVEARLEELLRLEAPKA